MDGDRVAAVFEFAQADLLDDHLAVVSQDPADEILDRRGGDEDAASIVAQGDAFAAAIPEKPRRQAEDEEEPQSAKQAEQEKIGGLIPVYAETVLKRIPDGVDNLLSYTAAGDLKAGGSLKGCRGIGDIRQKQ